MYRLTTYHKGKRIAVYCRFATARLLFPEWKRREPRTDIAIMEKGRIMFSNYAELLNHYCELIHSGLGYDKREWKKLAIGYQQEAQSKRNVAEITQNERTRARLMIEAQACYRVARALMGID